MQVARRLEAAIAFVSADRHLEPVGIQGLEIGEGLILLGAAAEVVSEFAAQLRRDYSGARLLLGGCLDRPAGYIRPLWSRRADTRVEVTVRRLGSRQFARRAE